MSGVPNIKIAESVEQLKSLMKQQKTPLNYANVQALYRLKIKAAPDSKILGSNYWTFRIDNSCLVTIISGRLQRTKNKEVFMERSCARIN